MSTITANAQKAVIAINAVAGTPGADPATVLRALLQLERHCQGMIRAEQEKDARRRGENPVSQATGD